MSEETATATATDELKLTPPDPVPVVAPEKAAGLVPLSTDQKSKLEERVDGFVDELVALDANSPEFGKKVDQLTTMGRKEIARGGGPVEPLPRPAGQGDRQRHRHRRRPDRAAPHRRGARPAANGKLLTKRGFLGIIPFGNRVTTISTNTVRPRRTSRRSSPRSPNGKDELLMDNAAIDTERRKLWKTMGKLEQMIHISRTLDEKLEDKANELDATDPAKAKAIRETALFYTRQRTTDLLTQMAVTVQGYLALDLVKKNNVELVKGVDRAEHHHCRCAAHRGHRRPGDDQPEAGAGADHRAQHHHRQHDRSRPAKMLKRPDRARSTSRRHRARSRWRRCSAPSRTSTTRWTRSTTSSSRRSTT